MFAYLTTFPNLIIYLTSCCSTLLLRINSNGKPVKNAVVDQKISQVCAAARVKVSYNCQNGECGTCEMKVNGRKVRACVGKVPAGKCAITTN